MNAQQRTLDDLKIGVNVQIDKSGHIRYRQQPQMGLPSREIIDKAVVTQLEAENAALKRVVADLIVTMKEPAIRGAKTVHQMCSFLDAWIVDLEQALLTTEEPE